MLEEGDVGNGSWRRGDGRGWRENGSLRREDGRWKGNGCWRRGDVGCGGGMGAGGGGMVGGGGDGSWRILIGS